MLDPMTLAPLPGDRTAATGPLPPVPPPVLSPTALAAAYGTPLYVYDLDRVRAAHADLRSALPPGVDLHYSVKANPHPLLVAALAEHGAQAEIASTGELDVALAGGIGPQHLQLAGPGKAAATVRDALDRGVRRFSVDSPHDLAELDRLAAERGVRVRAVLRVNAAASVAGNGLTMTGTASQFGADEDWVRADPAAFRGGPHATVTGLHLYAGSNLRDEDTLVRQFEVALRCAAGLRPVLPELQELNLGGGFGCPYAETGFRPVFGTLAERLAGLLDAHLDGWRAGAPQVSFESGRYLVGDCGTLLTRVLDVKLSRGRTFVVLDTGIHHLGGMSGLRRLRPMELRPAAADPDRARSGEPGPSGEPALCTLVGPLCTPLDSLAPAAPLADPRPGDLLSVANVGAYGLTASLIGFLSHPAPAEVVTDAGRVVDVSRLALRREPAGTLEARTGAHHGH